MLKQRKIKERKPDISSFSSCQ